jgi:hypothetical protein
LERRFDSNNGINFFILNINMKILWILILLVYQISTYESDIFCMVAEAEFVNSVNIDTIVYTPNGPTQRSNVHKIEKGYNIDYYDANVQVVDSKTGNVRKIFTHQDDKIDYSLFKSISKKTLTNNDIPDTHNGWVTYAQGYEQGINSDSITYFSTDWTVPSNPLNASNQVIFIFNALGGISNGKSHLIQPVLQWGQSAAGGGNYWAICNWYVCKDIVFHDSLIKVNPGTRLQGIIQLTNSSDSLYDYYSTFSGYSTISGLQINNLPHLNVLYEALEAYSIDDCDEYPIDEKVRMSKINIMIGENNPQIRWQTYNVYSNCKQHTEIVNESSFNGDIDIYFHSPEAIDNFDKIHIYPNPIKDFLHVSPNRILFNCKIEIFTFDGNLVFSDFYKYFDFEYNINFQDYSPGIYLIKFSYEINGFRYNKEDHVFKVIKK